jgi:hypothetical protein
MSGYVNYAERLLWDARSFAQHVPLSIQEKPLSRPPGGVGSLPNRLGPWVDWQKSHQW